MNETHKFEQISVLVPTRQRLPQLASMITSFELTRTGCSDLVFRVDDDDLPTMEYLLGGNWTIVTGPRHNGYRSLPRFFQELRYAATGDVLMCGNDDMLFQTQGWDAIVLAEANKYPDGLFNFGVETLNSQAYPFSIISRHVSDLIGFIHDERLMWGDLFLRDVLAAFGRSIRLKTVEIDHQWMGRTPDRVYQDGDQQNPQYWNAAYWEKHLACVREAVQRVDADRRQGPATG